MGAELSREEIYEKYMDKFVQSVTSRSHQALTVNQNIQMFSGLDSSVNLRRHYEQRRMEAADHAADWTKSLVDILAVSTPSPLLAGLGALAIAILIDVVSFRPPEESMKAALRSVFAEEKASEVWDQIDECLKRCSMHLTGAELQRDLERIEGQLSVAVTKLKNSMLRDGHMSNEALRAWVNGAAFHTQLLIHLQRLRERQSGPVERLLTTYSRDLALLFTKHKEVVNGKCYVPYMYMTSQFDHRYLVTDTSESHRIPFAGRSVPTVKAYIEKYYAVRYSVQKSDIEQYFSGVKKNLTELVNQEGSFNISRERAESKENFLPALDKGGHIFSSSPHRLSCLLLERIFCLVSTLSLSLCIALQI